MPRQSLLSFVLVALLLVGVEGASIALGGSHSCALLTDGKVMCWGRNEFGQLGNGTSVDSTTPVEVSGITTAADVALGGAHSCALLTDGKVMCWGLNSEGQLGDASSTNNDSPVEVYGLSTALGISLGESHSCARLTDGKVMCWGDNSYSQLGNGVNVDSSIPQEVSGITTATRIALGSFHSCALLADGKVMFWGEWKEPPGGRQIISSQYTSSTPVEVYGLATATSIALGGLHSCALVADGKVMCWGDNEFGQLGDGTLTDSTHFTDTRSGESTPPKVGPVEVSGITTAQSIALGGSHSCAVLSNGELICWGWNQYGQLGDGTTTNRPLREEVLGLNLASPTSLPSPQTTTTTSPPPSTTTTTLPPPSTTTTTLPPAKPLIVDESVSSAARYSVLTAVVLAVCTFGGRLSS